MPQLDLYFFFPSLICLFVVFFCLVFFCYFYFLPKLAGFVKMRQYPPVRAKLPARFQINVIYWYEESNFLQEPLSFTQVTENILKKKAKK